MTRLATVFLLFFAAGCGNDARFGGGESVTDGRHGEANAEGDPSLDPTNGADGTGDSGTSDAGSTNDGLADAGEDSGPDGPGTDGDGGKDPVDVPMTQSLYWHWPCAAKPSQPTPADPKAMVISGAADYMLENQELTLEVQGTACDPAFGPRDVLFLVDVSDSMRNFLNLGNDPVRNGTCGRNEAVKKVLDQLSLEARVALVTFDGNAQTVSNGYLEVSAFRTQYAKAAVLCKVGANTNFTKAFAAAQATLAKGRMGAAQELYFISDGEPNSTDADGHLEAAEIQKTAKIATVMLKGDEEYMRDVLASKDAQGNPLHAKVEKAADLAVALGELAKVELKEAVVKYGKVGDDANWKETALGLPGDLGFHLNAWTLKPADWPQGFGFTLRSVDSKGVITNAAGQLLWKP